MTVGSKTCGIACEPARNYYRTTNRATVLMTTLLKYVLHSWDLFTEILIFGSVAVLVQNLEATYCIRVEARHAILVPCY